MTAGVERSGGAAAGGDRAAHQGDGRPGGEGPGAQGSAAGVLADRMAAALVHREPGWKLPRRSALARRFNVSLAEIDVAVFTFENCLRSPSTTSFFARRKAGKACAIDTWEASSMMTMSNSPFSSGMYSA